MARGQQKIQSQQKAAKRASDAKRQQGHDQKAAAQKALTHVCSVCKVIYTSFTCHWGDVNTDTGTSRLSRLQLTRGGGTNLKGCFATNFGKNERSVPNCYFLPKCVFKYFVPNHLALNILRIFLFCFLTFLFCFYQRWNLLNILDFLIKVVREIPETLLQKKRDMVPML